MYVERGKQRDGSHMISIFHAARDEVIKSAFASGVTNYEYGVAALTPLLNRFAEQRKAQTKKFYDRLRSDIVSGCIMPPITVAFVNKEISRATELAKIQEYVRAEISDGYILDGMQRIITLGDASKNPRFSPIRPLYVNIIIAERYDLLLYRMITLNNGQKPMTARHQIEMLTKGAIDLAGTKIAIASEKQTEGTKIHGAFRMSDISEAYTAYLSGSLHNQNSKIIESKLDEILVGRVMESNVSDEEHTFSDILSEVGRLAANETCGVWLRQLNNLIGFTVGAKKSRNAIAAMSPDEFAQQLQKFEASFDAINPSRVNVGKYRRELSKLFLEGIAKYASYDQEQLESLFVDETMTE